MGRAIGHLLVVLIKVDEICKTKKAGESGGNRRESKLKKEIKELRQVVAKAKRYNKRLFEKCKRTVAG